MISNTQIIWGVISAVNNEYAINVENIMKIFAEKNEAWEENKFQIPESYLEIIAFDSSYTILKFKDKNLSEKFKNYFGNDAIELKKIK